MRKKLLLVTLLFATSTALASGVMPETSTVILNDADGGGSINVKNTEATPVLLYTRINNLQDDSDPTVIASQPVVRLEAGETQKVRFLINGTLRDSVEHIKRVVFESIPVSEGNASKFAMSVSQDVPLLIEPNNLKSEKNVWQKIKWEKISNVIRMTNTSSEVVRFQPQLQAIPTNEKLTIKKSYILPHETIDINVKNASFSKIAFSPVTKYGYSAGEQHIDL